MATSGDVTQAARRFALAAVQSMGNACITLQVPAPPVAGDDGEELGLSSPQFQALRVAPVAVRRSAKAVEVRVSADVLEQVFGVSGAGAVTTSVKSATSAVLGDERFTVSGVEAVNAGAGVCLYRFLLLPHATEVV